MISPNQFENLFKQVTDHLPAGMVNLQQDFEKNLRAAMEAAFHHMNLVTREEFEVQTALLSRTRAQLEALESKVAKLENPNATDMNHIND
jgi:BMFP domain-containing protein YqiC